MASFGKSPNKNVGLLHDDLGRAVKMGGSL